MAQADDLRSHLPARLRRLDDEIAEIELGLRALIARVIGGDFAQLPPHLVDRAKERVQKLVDRDPTKDAATYQQPGKLLEFFDLRDLEGVILSKAYWARFQPILKNKELLQQRFNQLAEIRNAIRHSRSVDQVMRKEGEAAVLWFQQLGPTAAASQSPAI